ncbi:probable malate:quinone oxidoreductase [Novimethylophilus kurashikiensis]|uniref:Probable malate:quinone oxidoreductase n=1 Tax=Novimethylophilus kurashikiensis TaxID=1825523 RepID=A0A2R5F7V2_9PROT|nr:hypothetical protein [Novimethylophilus kurashikiensis]GBG14320.1 probable malate:quinone oxidoreductase [Novimethylophilus kurashikiensis]
MQAVRTTLPLKEQCWNQVRAVIETEGPGTSVQIEYEQLAASYGDAPNDPVWEEFAQALAQ